MVLMDLSKAYVCFPNDLLLAKLAAYGFRLKKLKLFLNYLSRKEQQVKYDNRDTLRHSAIVVAEMETSLSLRHCDTLRYSAINGKH